MNEQERLYALALHLIPDQDVAGDIFMDVRTEPALLTRAARWRRQHQLPAVDAPAFLPALTPDQRDYAAHLARRGRRRRQMKTLAATAVAGILAVLVGARGLVFADRGLAGDPAYSAQPVTTSDGPALDFAVYKVEANPGMVTFWWAIQGRNAADEAANVELELGYNRRPTLATVVSHEATISREDRVVGRTTFQTPVPVSTTATLTVSRPGARPEWHVAVDLAPEPDPGARTIAVDQTVTGLSGIVQVSIVSVTIAEDYTIIRYQPQGEDWSVAPAHQLELVADTTRLPRYGVLRRYGDTEEREVLFGPMPEGAETLEVLFPRLTDAGPVAIPLP
ncbi:MAG: hypothetical protein K0R39_1223 [Symbiobacteriaceae bacterium]|jgi:hypothetical protein|nr:hypothetical protein [Symbiobacteriaceae bacterium]